MAKWTSLGHAMRRRVGLPSSHLESAGKPMSSRSVPTPEEIISSAEHANSPRRYVGRDAYEAEAVSAEPGNTMRVANKNTKAADPTAGGNAHRTNVLAGNAAQSERAGAKYSITQKYPAGTEPAAGPTMNSARIVPSVAGRQTPNFQSGIESTY